MTRRQRAGLVVISLALVLVAVIAGQHTHLVSGFAQAPPVPGPPVVGDCVIDPLPDRSVEVSPAVITATSGDTVPVYPAQQIQPCTASRYGEIVSVIATPGITTVKGDDTNGRYLDDPNMDGCFFAAYRYLGMTTKQPVLGFFSPYLQFAAALSRPSPRQEASGQHWAACIVSVPAADATTDQRPAPLRYDASLRDALHTGQQRDQLGICLQGWDDGFTSGGCRQRHTLELLGSGTSGDHPTTRDQVQSTCEQLVRQLTAMPDPTATGALTVQIHVADTDNTPITTRKVPVQSNLQCGITTTGIRKLAGSLLALGQQPIPWA